MDIEVKEKSPRAEETHSKEIHSRFRSHVHEFLCPASPDPLELGRQSIFVGGGITNCPDWQIEFADLVNARLAELQRDNQLPDELMLSMLNPRRINFPIHDPKASDFQITWEYGYLQESKAVSFWFPKNTHGPITLFETGRWLMSAKPLFLGIEPDYPCESELLAQLGAIRPYLEPALTLEAHADNVARWVLGIGEVNLPITPQSVKERSLYLAGGIKDCPDWQQEALNFLKTSELDIENPRMKDFVRGSDTEYRSLVYKNRRKLDASQAVLIWFPKEHLTPMALFELGTLIVSQKPLFIGIEPGYSRQIDVEVQTKLARPDIEIAYSLEDLTNQVRRYYSMLKN